MTELESGLYTIVTKYGVSALVIACITIFLIGVLKYFDVFKKVPKDNRKPIYYVLNYVFVFAITAAYYGIFKLNFNDYVAYAFVVASAVNLLYPIYENLKLRDLFKLIGNFIVKVVAKNQVETEKTKIKNQTETEEIKEDASSEVVVEEVKEDSKEQKII